MSDAAPPAPKSKSKKKLIVVVLAAVVLLAAAGGGAMFFLKSRAAAAAGEEGDEPAAEHAAHDDHKHPPVFLPLDNMVVNLADGAGDRFAQIGITFEVADEKGVEKLKARMPAIRNGILLLTSQRSAEDLLKREGKEQLAQDVMEEASKALGYEPEGGAKGAKGKKAKKNADGPNPVQGVLFSSFIIQ